MTNSCLGKIRPYYARFSEKDKIIANYILENPDSIIHRTINQVAEDLKVGDATVFRFCKRIGFKGYQAMKIALALESNTQIKQIHEEISEQDNEKTISEKVFKSNICTLEKTLKIMDIATIQKAVKLLQNANRVEFYGTGGSALIAMDAYHKFIKIGKKAFAFFDSHFQLMSASQLSKNDVAVVISHSGTNKNMLNILNVANEGGAKTIGITSFPRSPISLNVDVALYTSSDKAEYRSEANVSRIAQLSLIDALYVNLKSLNKEKVH